jgi:GT2 family glycosyltransferase
MRILAHIHSFNDADVIDRAIEAVILQTRPVDGILLVDNASSDDTLKQPSVGNATVLRHSENLGTSGSVYSGFRFALEQDYDWIWLFDADSAPEPDALEKLLALYENLSATDREQTAALACLPHNLADGKPLHGYLFTRQGLTQISPATEELYYPCHITIWSGGLYRVEAIRQVGLPDLDYVLDWGECEYAYRLMKGGWKVIVATDAILRHNIRGRASLVPTEIKFGPFVLQLPEPSPIRCYYLCRNTFYFALYVFKEGSFGLLRKQGLDMLKLTVKFMLSMPNHKKHIIACFRGIWHGLTGNIAARY